MSELSTSWHSYGKIYNLGHAALEDLFKDPVLIEEKVDGSQFSFGRFNGELRCRSKGQELQVDAPEHLFKIAVEEAAQLDLHDGWTYRAEYLQKLKHGALAYDRIPDKHLIIFDVASAEENYLPYAVKADEANRIGLETVPLLFYGMVTDETMFRELLETTSILGAQKIEGVVIKNYSRFGRDKKTLMGKFVSEAYKEVHKKAWKESNPQHNDILQILIAKYRHPGRWLKAIQHLREKGEIEDSPRDIGKLLVEAKEDLFAECKEEIAASLLKWAWPQIQRGAVAGLPEWYKDELLKKQFEATP